MPQVARSPLSPEPIKGSVPGALPPYLSNGLLGLRPRWMPPVVGVAIVNGFVGVDPATQVEGFAPAPYPLAFDVSLRVRGRAASLSASYGAHAVLEIDDY